MSTAFAWWKIARVGSFSRERLAPKRAARVSVGVVLPLLAGWLTGHVEYGVYMALGALPAGFASFQGETRTRVAAVAVASVGMALSTFVGATTAAAAPWSIVPIVAVWGYLVGLSICLGDRWSIAALQWAVALAIAVGFPAAPSEAAVRAGLVLSGGLLQAVLVAALWTLRPGGTERSALAASYRSLAAYAARLSEGVFELPPSAAFPAAGALEDPNPLLERGLRLLLIDLLEEAERVRAALAALAAQAAHQATDIGDLRALMAKTAAALELVADAVGGKPAQRLAALRALDARIAELAIPEGATWRWSGEALLGQLRAAARMVENLDVAPARRGATDTVANAASAQRPDELAWALATLRANLSLRTEAGRHALRLAVVAALAEALVQATGLYQGRWATLTIFLVLKPDYASTFSRGVERAFGTALGAAAGAAAVELARHIQGEMVAAAGIAVAMAYALFNASYLLFSALLTMFIVVLLALLGMPALPTAEARIYATFIGAALALTAYVVWPTWEGATAQEKFARLAEAHRDYALALLRELAHPGSIEQTELRALQAAARRVRSDAEAAAARLGGEPSRGRFAPQLAELLIAAFGRFAHAALALHALTLAEHRPAAVPNAGESSARVDDVAAGLGTAMSRIAVGLQTLHAPEPIPSLRPIYSRLSGEPALRDSALVPIVDRLVDATNTLDAVMRERLAS